MSVVLAADVGGTNARLSLWSLSPEGALTGLRSTRRPTAELEALEPLVLEFLTAEERREIAAFGVGVAGPVVEQRARLTNAAWSVDGDSVSRRTGIDRVVVLNDLVAKAWGLRALSDDEIVTLQAGSPDPHGSEALIAAGTGLGVALLPWVDGRCRPCASEGGHVDFAPRSRAEFELRDHLARRLGGRVSVERVVSGVGLHHIYEHLLERSGEAEPAALAAERARGDPSAAVAEAGLADESGLARRALDLFVSAYGAAAGNLALVTLSRGGVWVGGGIAPKILPRLVEGPFLEAFLDKGRFRDILERMPLRVVLSEDTCLRGAALAAGHAARQKV